MENTRQVSLKVSTDPVLLYWTTLDAIACNCSVALVMFFITSSSSWDSGTPQLKRTSNQDAISSSVSPAKYHILFAVFTLMHDLFFVSEYEA